MLRHLRRETGFVRREQQLGGIDQIDQLHQAHQIDRPIDPKHRGLGQLEFFAQEFRQTRRTVGRNLQPDRLTVMAVLQTLPQGHA